MRQGETPTTQPVGTTISLSCGRSEGQAPLLPSCLIPLFVNVSGFQTFASSPTSVAADTDEKARCIARMLCLVTFAVIGRTPVLRATETSP